MAFVWHELRVPDLDEAARFYGALLGWTFGANPMGRTIRSDGVPVGGVSAVKAGLGTHWTPYVETADVDAAAGAARAAGGVVTTGEPADVPGVGRIAPILDPEKSIFVAFAPVAPGGGDERPGRFVWARLRTRDPAGAAEFYAATFGWRALLGDGGGVLEEGGTRVAELVPAEADGPTGWVPFVLVADLDAALAVVTASGGTAGAVEAGGGGRYALVADSQGAEFGICAR